MTESLCHAVRDALLELQGNAWDFDAFREDPVGFAVAVLGAVVLPKDVVPDAATLIQWKREKRLILWHRQIEILEAAVHNKRIAVRSGHKVSKSTTAAILALWFYCCFEEARVVLTATTSRQVDAILWREIRKLYKRAVKPIPGELYDLARSGLKSEDFREIVGFTAKESEAVAGVSGANLLYLVDEASGIPDLIFEAIEGNRAGGARIVMFSNPTRTAGEFFEAHTSKALVMNDNGTVRGGFYKCIAISSEETPNAVHGLEIIPGLAGREWVVEKRAEWGVDSPLYKIRVLGDFAINEEGKIISVAAITEAEARWLEAVGVGRLYIGVDPAGPGGAGDESAFAWRRGKKALGLHAERGLDEKKHLQRVIEILDSQREFFPDDYETPVCVVDRDGPEGAKVYNEIVAWAHANPKRLIVVGFRGGEYAQRKPNQYDRARDELWGNLGEWMKDGAIPEDLKLAKELNAPDWDANLRNRLKATPKEVLRKLLDRSPDRADALALCCWEISDFVERVSEGQKQATKTRAGPQKRRVDAYGGLDWMKRRSHADGYDDLVTVTADLAA